MTTTQGSISRAPRPSSLADVLDLILDKGLVIDAYVRVSVVGIEILTIDARIVIASVDTYLHFAEAVNRLDLGATETKGLPELFSNNDRSRNGNGGNGATQDRELSSSGERGNGSSGASGSRRPGRGSRSRQVEGDDEDQNSRSGALVGRLAARGKRE